MYKETLCFSIALKVLPVIDKTTNTASFEDKTEFNPADI